MNPAPKKSEATIGTTQCTEEYVVNANQYILAGTITAPNLLGKRHSSGAIGLPAAFLTVYLQTTGKVIRWRHWLGGQENVHDQVNVQNHTEDHTDTNTEERHAGLLNGEPVMSDEDDGECLESQIEDTEHDSTPEIEKEVHSIE